MNRLHVVQMQFAASRTVQDLVPASLTTMEIHTKVVDRNVSSTLTVRQAVLAYATSVRTHAPEHAVKMQNAMLSIICLSAHVFPAIVEIRSATVLIHHRNVSIFILEIHEVKVQALQCFLFTAAVQYVTREIEMLCRVQISPQLCCKHFT